MPWEKEVFTGGSTHNAEKMFHLDDVIAIRNLQCNFIQIPTNNTFQSGTLVFSIEPLYSGRAIDAGCKSSRLSPRGLDMKSITWEMYHLFTHNVSFMLASVAGYYINHSLSSYNIVNNCFNFRFYYPKSVLVLGYCHRLRQCVCLSMCVCVSLWVNHLLVRAKTRDPFKLGSPNLDRRCKWHWLRSLLFLGLNDPDLTGRI